MDEETKKVVRLVAYGVGALVLIIAAFLSTFTVEQYERGIVKTWGKVAYVATPGLGFKIPFVQTVTDYRTDIRSVQPEKGVNTYTADNQEMDIVFTVFYRIPPDNVLFVYQNAPDYYERLFSIAVDRLKAEMGKTNVASFALHRGEVRDRIRDTLKIDAKAVGIEVTDFQLTDVQYTKSFRLAVEQAAAAKAMVETREQEKDQAVKVAERAKIDAEGKANAAREAAKGEADAKLYVAKAQAQAIQLEGEAKATAMRAQAEALARNPVLVEMKKAEQWNGALPTQMLSGVTPFMQFNAPK